MNEAATLASGLEQLDLEVEPARQHRMLAFLELLARWNRAFNLTAVRESRQMVVRHLLDSLSVLPWLGEEPALDIGTGAGLPGIPLALARPEQSFVLLDSNGKKTRFVRQAIRELGVANVEVVQSRAEQYRIASPQLITRAFAALPALIGQAGHLVARDGRMLAMKGALADQEVAGVCEPWRARVENLQVPGLDEPRRLVVLTRNEQGDPT